jgi:hypothetical protein
LYPSIFIHVTEGGTRKVILHTSMSHTIKRAKLFQLFIEKGVVAIIAIINNAIYDCSRIMMVSRISVYQSLEFCNFQSSFLR